MLHHLHDRGNYALGVVGADTDRASYWDWIEKHRLVAKAIKAEIAHGEKARGEPYPPIPVDED